MMCSQLSRYALKPWPSTWPQRMAGGISRGLWRFWGFIGRAAESIAWHLERLEIGSVTLRVRMEKDESVHRLKGLVLKEIGSTEQGFSVEEPHGDRGWPGL